MAYFCKCGESSNKNYCLNASKWIDQCYKVFDYELMKADYENLLLNVKSLESWYQQSFTQIWKDIVRTFQKHEVFKFGSV